MFKQRREFILSSLWLNEACKVEGHSFIDAAQAQNLFREEGK
jgi:hypothetical protein